VALCIRAAGAAFALSLAVGTVAPASVLIPDGRTIAPAGFTIPVESFASQCALSPDGKWLAVLALDRGAIDIIDTHESILADRLVVPHATGFTWTTDGLYVSAGYTGTIARFGYDGSASKAAPKFVKRTPLQIGPGLLNGIAENPKTHRVLVARTAAREVVALDDSGAVTARYPASGQPFDIGITPAGFVASLYDSDHVDAWSQSGARTRVATGPHPTRLLVAAGRVFVADADGHEVVELSSGDFGVKRRFDLAVSASQPPGQTPAGMALSNDGTTLFVAESGFNDVAAIELATGRVAGRIPTGWYPTDVAFLARSTVGKKDDRIRPQLWIASAKGMGSQPDPAGEWNGTYTGIVQHLVADPEKFSAWSRTVAGNDRFDAGAPQTALPPIKHVVFIVKENKHFDEEFADVPGADADPKLLLYGQKYTPNAHALAEGYTLFDNFMSDGEASIYGHAWTTQAMANDYHERNAHARDEDDATASPLVPWSIWPFSLAGEDTLTAAQMDFDWYRDLGALPGGPRMNVSGVFGPRGELIDELQRHGISFRVYGEQMTMLPSGAIAPGLAAHAARDYPGAHIDFGVRDSIRAQRFLADVDAHGLAAYSYLTLPTDHTAGSTPGLLTPASFVASNDAALGTIVAALSRRPDWKSTVVFVTFDDAQGTGDHVDDHRMAAFAVGPYVRRGYIDGTRYALPSILRTVEVLFGVNPLNIYDAAAPPMFDAFAAQPDVSPYAALPANIPIVANPGVLDPKSVSFDLDGPASALIPAQEWASVRGAASLASHEAYLQRLGSPVLALSASGVDR
jgi:YVTN family beta-propeller protein